MLPPKLSVRPSETRADEDARAATEGMVDPSEVMAHEGWRGLPSNVAHLPSADRRSRTKLEPSTYPRLRRA